MPYVNIKITDEDVTVQQKIQLISGASQLLSDVLNKDPSTTYVVIDEVDTDNWGVGLTSVTQMRNQARPKSKTKQVQVPQK